MAAAHRTPPRSSPPTVTGHHRFGGPIAGAQVGYNYVLPSQLLLGAEADVSFANYWPSNGVAATLPGPNGNITEQVDFISTFRGRVGGVFGPWMIYGTGGLALAGGRFLNPQAVGDDQKRLGLHTGWTAGAGVEWAFDPVWTARLEYLYDSFEKGSVTFRGRHALRLRLEFPDRAAGSQPEGHLGQRRPGAGAEG